MQKGKILIPKGQKERKSVTFAIRLRTIWYDREGVKFQDSGSEIERNIVSGAQRFLFRSKYDSSYATFTPTLAYLWYLVPTLNTSILPPPLLFSHHSPKM